MNIEDRIKQEIENEGDSVDSALGIALTLIVVLFCAFALGLVWQLAQPWVAELLTAVWGLVK